MAKLRVVAAAKAVGVSRATIRRYLDKGKISSELGRRGERLIDTAELERVFGTLHQEAEESVPGAARDTGENVHPCVPDASGDNPSDSAVLQARLVALERENTLLRTELSSARAEKDRLFTLVEQGQQRVLLLTDQRRTWRRIGEEIQRFVKPFFSRP